MKGCPPSTIISTVFYVNSGSIVIIENQSTTKIENILLTERDHVYEFGSLLPNTEIEKKLHFQSEGTVRYSFTRDNEKHEGIIFGYVTGGVGNTAVMIVTESGKIIINQKI